MIYTYEELDAMNEKELQDASDWQDQREARYLEAQKYILVIAAIVLASAVVTLFVAASDHHAVLEHDREHRNHHPIATPHEVSVAAKSCWDQGMRALMHIDGKIECHE